MPTVLPKLRSLTQSLKGDIFERLFPGGGFNFLPWLSGD